MKTTSVTLTETGNQPWNEPWPANELQEVPACPVCEVTDREILHDGLVDNVFFVAAGRWTLHRCLVCRCAYLDPRPDEASIGNAYGRYYTHEAGTSTRRDYAQLGPLRRIVRKLANGYVNRRYGTQRRPENAFGYPLLAALPRIRQTLDVQFRYLPRSAAGHVVLDVGCGNGSFLASAEEAGWQAVGIDPDPQAVAAAKAQGLDARLGSLDSFDGQAQCFDAITLSHVIEHVHQPRQVVQALHRLLKPGGMLYVDTPNIDSTGASEFGRSWRGLETPRHLVLFNQQALVNLLESHGFQDLDFKRRTKVRDGMTLSSLRIKSGHSPYDESAEQLPRATRLALLLRTGSIERDEFLTLTARKAEK